MNTTSDTISENYNDIGALDSNRIFTHLNVHNITSMPSAANNHSDNWINEQPSITVIPHLSDPVSLASNASRPVHTTNLTVLTSPDMSYTGTGANLPERSSGSQVGTRVYPLESVVYVTAAGKAQLTTSQSREWEPRTEYGVQIEESTEQPALPMEVSVEHTLLETEREARSSHNGRKRKEHPTTEENTHNRSRLKLSIPAATTVQVQSGMNSLCTHVNQTLPVTDSERIQHRGRVQPRRPLMAHGKGGTGNSSDVPDTEEMAASSEKVPAKTSLPTTPRGIKGNTGKNGSQSLQLKHEGSDDIGGVG